VGLNIAPTFRIIANDKDITAKIRERVTSINLTDETGTESDVLEIKLADHLVASDPIKLPATGAELEVSIGFDEQATPKGTFIVDEIELTGFPCEMVIRARAAPFETTPKGRVYWQTHKTRSWKAGTTLGAIVKRIASEHRLTPAISSKLASVVLPHTDQAHESDMNFITRLAKRFDAIAKPAGGRLVFAPKGKAETVGGANMPRVTLTPKDGGAYRVAIHTRDTGGTCIAHYRNLASGESREVSVGSGEPVHRLRHSYRDAASAEAAARAKLRHKKRAERTLSYTLPGRPELAAETIVTMKGFREGVDGDWLVKRCNHYIGSEGYRTSIECERPNSHPDVMKADQAPVSDQARAATFVE
jgi:hypothetical protein